MKYIITHCGYLGMPPRMRDFDGTYRQLLEHLGGVTPENRHVPFRDKTGKEIKIDDMTDEELKTLFDKTNGSGGPYYMVWSVEEQKQILGYITRGH